MSNQTLYRFFDDKGRLLYVGITDTWYQRFHEHERKSGWFSKVAYSTFEYYETRQAVQEAELLAIRTENPEFNKLHNPAYETTMDHFAKLKSWTHTDLIPDQLHLELVREMKKHLWQIKAGKQSKWVAMAFIDMFYYLGPKGLINCRNCVALSNSRNVNTWHGDAYMTLEKTYATN
jgi:predicted GIY-YIG superfamily endonuclease